MQPLPATFFAPSVLRVTRRLIGCHLVRRWRGRLLVGRIVEAEAYAGQWDPAAHSFRGPTDRCRTMFGPPGHAYVYFTYGAHHCVNVTTGPDDVAGAVLIRAVEPCHGISTMRQLRLASTKPGLTRQRLAREKYTPLLTNGPGKLTLALAIDGNADGIDLTRGEQLWLSQGSEPRRVAWTPRIGLGQNPARDWFWRCVDEDSACLTPSTGTLPSRSRPTPTLRSLRQSKRDADKKLQ